MNIAVFLPVGFILGCSFSFSKWWMTLIIGLGLSFSIELIQLGFQRGLFELDDLFHNILGCLIGLLVALIVKFTFHLFVDQDNTKIPYKN